MLTFAVMNIDELYMSRCLQLARMGCENARPNPMVGAVIVYGDRIIGEGYHIRAGQAHAEVNAFNSISEHDRQFIKDSTLYVSLEPCAHYGKTPPCADLIVSKGVRRVVVGCKDSFSKVNGQGIKRILDAGIDVSVGVLEKECLWLNRRFFTFNNCHRPYITLKWAQSADGFIDDNGRAVALSSAYTKMLVHKLRSESDAILVGSVTDSREHPQLNVRHWTGRSPHKYVLSHDCTADDIIADCVAHKYQSLLVEGGLQTLQTFISRGLFDAIRIETAPFSLGNGTPAPLLPDGLQLVGSQQWDGRDIELYIRK